MTFLYHYSMRQLAELTRSGYTSIIAKQENQILQNLTTLRIDAKRNALRIPLPFHLSFKIQCLFFRAYWSPENPPSSPETGNRGEEGWFASELRSHAQQCVIVIDVEQRPMIAGYVAVPMIRVTAEVLENPVGGAS